MNTLTLATIAAGRIALGLAVNGPALSQIASRRQHEQTAPKQASKDVPAFPDRAPAAAIYATILGGWLTERQVLLRHGLEKDAKAMVTLKDAFIAGTVVTGVAYFIAEEVARRSHPHDTPTSSEGALAPRMPAETGALQRYFSVIGALNRVFVVGAVGATPFINFALFNDYRPNPRSQFFSL